MWQEIEARIVENDRDGVVPLRKVLLEALRNSLVRPGSVATKKMAALEFGSSERLVWQIEGSGHFFYLNPKWQDRLEQFGLDTKPFPYRADIRDGARHSGLSREWSFGSGDCIQTRIDSLDAVQRLLAALELNVDGLKLNPAAVTRWIERLRHFFPSLDRFDRPDPEFDAMERNYKFAAAKDLRAALNDARDDQDYVDAIHSALTKSNLLPWRSYWPMSPKGDGDRTKLWPAVSALGKAALDDPTGHAQALQAFVTAWTGAVPKGSADSARQIAEFLFMHLWPDIGTYIRFSVREDFWLESLGSKFPVHESVADTYADEQRFMAAVRRAFEDRGLAPRDMVDVQSALWVVHNYKDEEAEADFNREAIEAAMDAYQAFQDSGANNELFEAFGEPRDYWVRSTRQRTQRVFPTKPLIGFLLKRTELNGGWGQKADAAARLHNAGFIIVDKTDQPVEPPDLYQHLIGGADRIRICALNYWVAPAREVNAAEVSIRAGDLANALGLQNAFSNICQALGGEKFQALAQVPPPTFTEPNPSSSTTFTYRLGSDAKAKAMPSTVSLSSSLPTNLILCGPPGTGKTYETAWEAVRICLGDEIARDLRDTERRADLMVEYKKLIEQERIEFVTFHQSISYEEFVEGQRPETGPARAEGGGDTEGEIGFRLQVHDGVFKRISERARLDRKGSRGGPWLNRKKSVFKLSMIGSNWRPGFEHSIKTERIYWLFGGRVDWSSAEYDQFETVKARWQEDHPDATGQHASVSGTWYFRSALEVDDYIILTVGKNRVVAVGRVTGPYEYRPELGAAEVEATPHTRSVEWLWHNADGIDRSKFYPKSFSAFQPIYGMDAQVDWDALEDAIFPVRRDYSQGSSNAYVLIIDEINRANISKVLGELITLIEPDKRLGAQNEIRLTLPYSKKLFGVPANLHIIGTMNTADRSIALLDTALRRRFIFRELMPNPSVLPPDVDGVNLQRMLTILNDRIEYLFDREHQIGHAYFTACRSRNDIDDVMRYKVIPLLTEYFFEDWSKVAAVLGDAISGSSRFLEARRLPAPAGIGEEDVVGERIRWRVKDSFDFSEFTA